MNLDVSIGNSQCLRVGVDSDELDAANALFDHAVDGVGATATYTHHLDDGKIIIDLVLVHLTVLRTVGKALCVYTTLTLK